MTIVMEVPEKGLVHLILNRPERRNALDGSLVSEWLTCLDAIAGNPAHRVLMISATGKDFCAGADIRWMQSMANASLAENEADALQLASLFYRLHTLPIPVIVLVQGTTMGGGIGIVAACDIVVAEDNATFSFPETRIGLSPSVVSPWVMSVMGERRARYYFLTGETFNARQAEVFGLVQQVVLPSEREKAGLSVVRSILDMSPFAMAETRRLLCNVSQMPVNEALLRLTAGHLARMRKTPDAEEGLRAFFEKRKPVWKYPG